MEDIDLTYRPEIRGETHRPRKKLAIDIASDYNEKDT
jgi:hypothetical protein